jgi:hypothetical protein
MLIELWERLRGYDKWVPVEARIESTRVWKRETRYGTVDCSDDVMLWTDPTGMNHRAPFTTQDGSPLFELIEGSTRAIRYNPADPEEYYCRELYEHNTALRLVSVVGTIGIIATAIFLFWSARPPR